MIREIKFRFWDISKGEMILNNSFYEIQKFNRTEDELFFIVPMQFTGVKDSFGLEIFEGDILELVKGDINYKFRFTVSFEDGGFVAYHTQLKDCFGNLIKWGSVSSFIIKDLPVRVIGNIYENRELLNN